MPQRVSDVRSPSLTDRLANWLMAPSGDPYPPSPPAFPQYWDSPAQIWARHIKYPVPRDPALNDLWMVQGDQIGPTGTYSGRGRTLRIEGEYDPDKKLIWYSNLLPAEQRYAVAHELSHAITDSLTTDDWADFSIGLANLMGNKKFKSYSSYEWPLAEILATYTTTPEQLDPKVRDYIGKFFALRRKVK